MLVIEDFKWLWLFEHFKITCFKFLKMFRLKKKKALGALFHTHFVSKMSMKYRSVRIFQQIIPFLIHTKTWISLLIKLWKVLFLIAQSTIVVLFCFVIIYINIAYLCFFAKYLLILPYLFLKQPNQYKLFEKIQSCRDFAQEKVLQYYYYYYINIRTPSETKNFHEFSVFPIIVNYWFKF